MGVIKRRLLSKTFAAVFIVLILTAVYFLLTRTNQESRINSVSRLTDEIETLPIPDLHLPERTFWTSDLHDGTRIDTPLTLFALRQKVIVYGCKLQASPYPEAISKLVLPTNNSELSMTILNHETHSLHLNESDIQEHFEFYKDNELIQKTDAFICSFPASFCEAWMPFNKSIVFLPAHRFSLGRCSKERMQRLIEHVQALDTSISPRNFIAASSVYDAEYINYYTGLNPIVLSSTAFFYAGRQTTKYTKRAMEILVGPLQLEMIQHHEEIVQAAKLRSKKENWEFVTAKGKYGIYKLQDVANHRAAVIFPYAVMSYGITELYAMAVPMLVPSIEFIVKNNMVRDRSLIDDVYCGLEMEIELPDKHPETRHPYSPDTYEPEAYAYWMQFADFYQWPHITVFNDYNDLIDKLEAMDFDDIHQKMIQANAKRESELLDKWALIIRDIDKNRQVPKDYSFAIRELWNLSSLQVN